MAQRITSPEELNSRVKVSRLKVWVILVVLTLGVIGGLIWFLTRDFVVEEVHPCYVTATCMPADEALYDIFKASFGDDIYFTIDTVRQDYGSRLDTLAQIAFLVVDDVEKSDVTDGMAVQIGATTGYVASMPAAKSEYAVLAAHGVSDDDMRAAGLNPGLSYYLCEVLIEVADERAAIEPGIYEAHVELDLIEPSSLILR